MHVLLRLSTDGDCYLIYNLAKILQEEKTIEYWTDLYKNKVIIYQGKGYLNGEIISERQDLDQGCPAIFVKPDKFKDVSRVPGLGIDVYDDERQEYKIYIGLLGNVYYLMQTDGNKFEL